MTNNTTGHISQDSKETRMLSCTVRNGFRGNTRPLTVGAKVMAKRTLVCIDPGHGGKQCGAVSKTFGYKESDIVLDISMLAAAYLMYAVRDTLSGGWALSDVCPHIPELPVDVIMTRASDTEVTLSERCAFANKAKASCFVSIHCNSYNGVTANGIETWYYKSGSRLSKTFADEVHGEIMTETAKFRVTEKDGTRHAPKNRGVKTNTSYYTLKHTTMPSLVVECGFMSHDGEVKLMMTDEYKAALARGIARGILNTFAT